MEYLSDIEKPSKKEQIAAKKSYSALVNTVEELQSKYPEIEIEETSEKVKIPFTKVGRHRRVMFEDVLRFKKVQKTTQEQLLIQMMKSDKEAGLYDS